MTAPLPSHSRGKTRPHPVIEKGLGLYVAEVGGIRRVIYSRRAEGAALVAAQAHWPDLDPDEQYARAKDPAVITVGRLGDYSPGQTGYRLTALNSIIATEGSTAP